MDKLHFNSSMVSWKTCFAYLDDLNDYFSPLTVESTEVSPFIRFSPGIKAVLFDIYGTLLISEAGDIGLTNLGGGSDQIFKIELEDKSVSFSFDKIRSLLADSVEKNHSLIKEKYKDIEYPEVDIITLWFEVLQKLGFKGLDMDVLSKNALRFEVMSNKVALMPRLHSLFKYLRTKSMPLGIVSNAQFYTPLLIEYLAGIPLDDLGFHKELRAWSFEVQRGKPDSGLFSQPLMTLSRMGINSQEILYVGNDMLNDIATANKLGMKTALFAGDRRSLRFREGDPRVEGVHPDFIVTELMQLQQILEDGMNG